jgi:hypothetical protein
MRRRIMGRLGCGGGPASAAWLTLFPPEPQMLEESKGKLAQQHVVVQTTPAPALEVVQAQLVLELLVHLLADPACLDLCCQSFE